jgi:hypothetical protein
MSLPSFAVTYDYRCPFARNVHEHLITALEDGADWDVRFLPFSLTQVHVDDDGGVPVWDDPDAYGDHMAIEAGLVVSRNSPERFLAVHRSLFAARHDEARDITDRKVISEVLATHGVEPEPVFAEVDAGWPREEFRTAHTKAVDEHQVFGVPTFIVGPDAVFARVMTRPAGDAQLARSTIERIVRLTADHPELNELKHTTVRR